MHLIHMVASLDFAVYGRGGGVLHSASLLLLVRLPSLPMPMAPSA